VAKYTYTSTSHPPMIDVTVPDHVEVTVRSDRKVVWVNIDGMCVLRISQIKHLVTGQREEEE